MKIAALFPGQGSQQVGMGSDLAKNSNQVAELFKQADKCLGYELSKLCFEGPIESLTLTQNAQPALLVCSVASYLESNIHVSVAAGHSLGEYSALVAAGCIKFEDAIALVHKRGCYMQEAVQPGNGKMAAIMGPSEEEILNLIQQIKTGVVEIANLNSQGQTVVAGDITGVDSFCVLAKSSGAKVIPLNVSAPFHCSLMEPAAIKLTKDLDAVSFSDPQFPVYANVSAQPLSSGNEARELLKQQVCGSVRWAQSMTNMLAEQNITHCIEFGPGGVLSKLMKRICPSVERLEVFDMQTVTKAKDLG